MVSSIPKRRRGGADTPERAKAQSCLSSQLEAMRAKASVATPRSWPRTRSAESPTAAAASPPASAAASMDSARLPVASRVGTAASAPTAPKASCPRESCPPMPVRKLTDTATAAKPNTTARTKACWLEIQAGSRAATAMASAATTTGAQRMSRSCL